MLVLVCKWTTCVMSEFELECQRQRKMIGRSQKKKNNATKNNETKEWKYIHERQRALAN